MKTAKTIEAHKSGKGSDTAAREAGRQRRLANLVAPWKPGQSGNPGGRPKNDMRQVIARAVFEKNAEAIYRAYTKLLLKGSAFGYQVVGEAGYGKLKETRDTGSDFHEVPDEQLQQEIERIMGRLGIAREADAAAQAGVDTARAAKSNGEAKIADVLPR
jgi:hypothetical protein